MIRDLTPYPAYKDSGVPWLGQVPEHWEVRKLRALFNKAGSGTTPSGEEFYGGDIPWVVTGDLNDSVLSNTTRTVNARALEKFSALRLYPKDSLIIAMYGATIGKTAILGTEACTNQACCVLAEPRTGVLVRYIQPAVISAKGYLVQQGYGGGQPNINSEIVHSLRVPVPPFDEQTAIVRFLDYMDRRIRRVVHARQRQIKLLEEYRQALIHQAVTGQIDVRTGKPYPAYKDSGVEWLGKVPEHWEVRRLKTAVDHINEQTSAKTDEDLYVALEHVESWTGRLLLPSDEVQFDSQVKRFQAGDVLFGKLRPYLAKVVRPKQSGVCVGEFFVLRARPVLTPQYLEVALRSAPAIDFVNSSTYGAKMPRADWTFVGAMLFPLPPLPEQTAIVEYLDSQTAKIDAAIATLRREIELLREYRERLIADVVTGKVDVRAVAEQLPEEPPEEESDGPEPLDELETFAREGEDEEGMDLDTVA